MGLESLDSAIRMKQLIRKQATREIAVQVPTSVAGRVIDVNIDSLTATVWFAGDPEPLEVFLFSHLIPGNWERKAVDATSVDSTSVTGYGSYVLCQRFNGKLYITQVLTGGQLAHDANVMNLQMVQQNAVESLSDRHITGSIYETSINCKIEHDSVAENQAVKFGPFVTADLVTPNSGFVECTVRVGEVGIKSYKLALDVKYGFGEFDNDKKWFRLLPEHEKTATSQGAYSAFDFDLDVSQDFVQYREAEEKLQFLPVTEVWFRIVKRGDWSGLDADFTIKTGVIQQARRNNGVFQQILQLSPMPAIGFVGVNNSRGGLHDHTYFENHDTFDRALTDEWGTSDDFITWVPEANPTSFYTDYIAGRVIMASAATNYLIYEDNTSEGTAVHQLSLPALTTGSYVELGPVMRRVNTANHYSARLRFNTDGTLTLAFVKRVASVETTVTSAATGLTYAADTLVWIRYTQEDDSFRARVWLDGTDEPTTWLIDTTDVSLTGQNGYRGFIARRNTGNTNTNMIASLHSVEVRAFWNFAFREDSLGAYWNTGPYRGASLRLSQDLQKTCTFDGPVIWTGSRIRWTGALVLGGIGRHRNGLLTGKGYCAWNSTTQPRKLPSGDFANGDATGIELLAGESLWIALEPGRENEDLNSWLIICEDTEPGFQLPEWWVLVAHRPHRGNYIRLGDGRVIDAGRSVDSQTSNSGAFNNVTEGTIHTVSNHVWRAYSAYRVELRTGSNISTGTGRVQFRLRKTNNTGTLLIDWGWQESEAAPPARGHYFFGYVRRNAATDLTATAVVTGLSGAAGYTGTAIANTTLRRALSIEYAGPSDQFPDAFDIT